MRGVPLRRRRSPDARAAPAANAPRAGRADPPCVVGAAFTTASMAEGACFGVAPEAAFFFVAAVAGDFFVAAFADVFLADVFADVVFLDVVFLDVVFAAALLGSAVTAGSCRRLGRVLRRYRRRRH